MGRLIDFIRLVLMSVLELEPIMMAVSRVCSGTFFPLIPGPLLIVSIITEAVGDFLLEHVNRSRCWCLRSSLNLVTPPTLS